jgi:hypothetical protein
VAVNFIGGGNWSTRRKLPTCSKSLINLITYSVMLYRVHLTWAEFELTTLVVIGIECIGSCKSIYDCQFVYITRLFYTYIWLISKSAVAMEINWYNLYKNSIVFYLKVCFFVFCKFVVVCVAWYTDHLGMLQGSVRHATGVS